jgi:hypothetical protein
MKPVRNPHYLRFIRTQPCCVCGRTWGVEAAHTGPRGLGQKASDESCIPLCWVHHRTGRDSYHALGRVKFLETHMFNLEQTIWILQDAYRGVRVSGHIQEIRSPD